MSLVKGYKKKQGGELQRKVLKSLIIAGTAYACTFGGGTTPSGRQIIRALIL